MRWAAVLLAIVWIGIAAGVTTWALRARRDKVVDLRAAPEGLLIVDRIEAPDLVGGDEPAGA